MFGIGFTEFLFIVAIAFVVLGPEKLYELAIRAGKFYRKLKHLSEDLGDSIKMGMDEPVLREKEAPNNEEKNNHKEEG